MSSQDKRQHMHRRTDHLPQDTPDDALEDGQQFALAAGCQYDASYGTLAGAARWALVMMRRFRLWNDLACVHFCNKCLQDRAPKVGPGDTITSTCAHLYCLCKAQVVHQHSDVSGKGRKGQG